MGEIKGHTIKNLELADSLVDALKSNIIKVDFSNSQRFEG